MRFVDDHLSTFLTERHAYSVTSRRWLRQARPASRKGNHIVLKTHISLATWVLSVHFVRNS